VLNTVLLAIAFMRHPVDQVVYCHYLCRRLASEGIVTLGVTLCVCPPSRLYHVPTACRNGLGGEGNALYPVLSSLCLQM